MSGSGTSRAASEAALEMPMAPSTEAKLENKDLEAGCSCREAGAGGGPLGAGGADSPRSVSAYAPSATVAATLSWLDVVVTAKNAKGCERLLLRGVDGYVQPGNMLAIMGPSGCGKTTLLDTLAGRLASNAQYTGDIRVNGRRTKLTGRSAYAMQDDVLIGTLTVFETINYVAKLRLPQGMPGEEKLRIVDDIVAKLGLDSARDTYIGTWHLRGVSSGQRRRVSIGCELVTNPKLIFLDEPTSGLDSAAAFYVMAAVRRVAERQRTILAVIHQPSSEVFALFDKLCLLSEGRVVYFGAANRAIDFFAEAGLAVPSNRNPADHFLHSINPDFAESERVEENIETLTHAYQASPVSAALRQAVAALHAAPGELFERPRTQPRWPYQTAVLTRRTLLNNTRNFGVFWVRLVMYVLLCLTLSFVFIQLGESWKDTFSRTVLLFFVVAFLTFMSIAAFPAFVEDMKVFVRERLNGYYGVLTFTVANTLAGLPFIALIAVVCTVCFYFTSGLRGGADHVWTFIALMFASLVVVESLMMAIAPLVPHYLMGIAVGAGVLGIFMVVCGFFKSLNQVPAPILRYPLSYVAYHTYAFAGFMHNEFQGTTGWGCPCAVQPEGCSDPTCTVGGEAVLDYYGVISLDAWPCVGILAAMALAYRAVFYLTLRARESWSRRRLSVLAPLRALRA